MLSISNAERTEYNIYWEGKPKNLLKSKIVFSGMQAGFDPVRANYTLYCTLYYILSYSLLKAWVKNTNLSGCY